MDRRRVRRFPWRSREYGTDYSDLYEYSPTACIISVLPWGCFTFKRIYDVIVLRFYRFTVLDIDDLSIDRYDTEKRLVFDPGVHVGLLNHLVKVR